MKKSSKTKASSRDTQDPIPNTPAPIIVTSLSELAQEPVVVRVRMRMGSGVRGLADGGTWKTLEIRGRRLLPGEAREVQRMLEGALPPRKVVKNDQGEDEERYDILDPGYLEQKQMVERRARAYAITIAYPVFKVSSLEFRVSEPPEGGTPNAEPETRNPKPETSPPLTAEERRVWLESQAVEEDLLMACWGALVAGWVETEEGQLERRRRVNFT